MSDKEDNDNREILSAAESEAPEQKETALTDDGPESVANEEKHENSTHDAEQELEEVKEEVDEISDLPERKEPRKPGWSLSQWSEDFESIEDEKVSEAIHSDPKKEILWAAEKNELETLRRLLEEDPSLVNARDNDSYTPLHRACYNNHTEVLKILLSYDADIGSKTEDGWEPLHCACKWDSVEAVSLLLQNGANVNATTKGNLTPLHLAASNVSGRRTLELLLWHPYINASLKNEAGDTAYDIAYRSGPLSNLFEILDASINVY